MADRGWVDTLSEDWISQPRSSSPYAASRPGTMNSLASPGTTRVHHERSYTKLSTTRHRRRHSNDTLGSLANSQGTTQLHSRRMTETPEWKRRLMEDIGNSGGKDLFSPLQLENLFRPPTVGPNSSPRLPPPQPTPPRSPRRSYLPSTQTSPFRDALPTLEEESGSTYSAQEPAKQPPQVATETTERPPILRPLTRYSRLSHRRTTNSTPAETVLDGASGKRIAERYKAHEPEARNRFIVVRPKPRSIRISRPGNRYTEENERSSEEDAIMRNEVISPVSVGALDCMDRGAITVPPQLERGSSNPESDLSSYPREQKDNHEEQKVEDTPAKPLNHSVGRFMQAETSYYPSSPPVYGYRRYSPEESFQEEDTGVEQYDEDYYDDDETGFLPSPYKTPAKAPPTPPSPEMRPRQNAKEPNKRESTGSALLRNIRNHKEAPRSPIKPQPINLASGGSNRNTEQLATPHSSRQNLGSDSVSPPILQPGEAAVPKNKHSRSPLKLFSGVYDTYTDDMLRKRLGEFEEESEDQDDTGHNRTFSYEYGADVPSEEESERSYGEGSMVVNRLEELARQMEKEEPPAGYTRRSKIVQYDEVVEKVTKTTTTTRSGSGQQRSESSRTASMNQESLPRSGQKHRRWISEEAPVPQIPQLPQINTIPRDSSPVKERTPKRPRRASAMTTTTSRPGSSNTANTQPASPAVRRRVNSGIEEGSILASSRRRSRANSKESEFSTQSSRPPIPPVPPIPTAAAVAAALAVAEADGTPSPSPRKKKPIVLKDAGQVAIAPAINSPRGSNLRKIVFSGSKGDGMQGESFQISPEPKDNPMGGSTRRGSVTTQDFLEQAEQVMARIRALGLRSENSCSSDMQFQRRTESSRGSAGRRQRIPSIARNDDYRNGDHDDKPVTADMVERLHTVARNLSNHKQGKMPAKDNNDRDPRSQRSTRSSVRVISNVPEELAEHLASKSTNDMTFDQETLAWVSRTPEKEENPLKDISDLAVDEKQEERVLELARSQWMNGSTAGDERSGVWRSSRMVPMDETDLREIDGGPGGDATWDKSHWGHSRAALASSVGSSNSLRTNDSEFDVHGARTVTRTTSYGTDEAIEKDVKEAEVPQKAPEKASDDDRVHDNNDNANEKNTVEMQKLAPRFANEGFPSSPLKNEVTMASSTDDDIDAFLEHGSLRQPNRQNNNTSFHSVSRRKSIGRTFVGRHVTRITEEGDEGGRKNRFPDPIEREFRRSLSSALTPLQTPFKSQLSSAVPPSNHKGDVSFFLSPLPDLSYRFETTEALISLELSYITARRGPKATTKAIEASFSIAQANVVKHLTDVEPYDPYWDFIKCLKLNDRKLETLHTLNEFCPRLAELDVSGNELGQLTGVPESVMTLTCQKNCLTDVTFFGHLNNLQFLDISGNGLENLDALATCLHLRELKADDNALTNIDGIFKIEGLMTFRARRNNLETVDFSGAELKRLTELDLRSNQITDIHGLEELPALVHLNLDQNQLSDLNSPRDYKLHSIRSIKLTQNTFQSFDVSPFPNLRILYMDNNALSHVGGLTRAKSIDAVSFRDQRTATGTFDLDLNRMFETRKLYLSSNPIGALSEMHAGFLNLQFLEMASCHLRTLPKNIANLIPNVRVLNLNYNALSDLRPLAGLNRLVKLSVAHNRLSKPKYLSQALERCRGIKWVDFRGNPMTQGFYPAVMTVVKQQQNNPDEYQKDPFEIVAADEEKDRQHLRGCDLRTRCERRRYWLMVANGCRKLKGVDGLDLNREELEKEDEVWREMVNRGWVEMRDE